MDALYNRAMCHGLTCNSKLPGVPVLHENRNHGRAVDSRYVVHHVASLSPKQHSMIRFVCIPHIGTKRKPLTKAGNLDILVHVVATYDASQAVLNFLCHVLRTSP